MKQHYILLFILIVSFALRLAAIGPVHVEKYSSDEIEYIGIARYLAQGGEFVDSNGDKAIRAPLYPFILSYIFLIFDENLLPPQIFGCVLSSIAVLLSYLLCIQLWKNKKVALIAAGVVALYPGLIICAGMIQTENLYIVLFLLSLLFAIRISDHPTLFVAIGLGVCAALAALTRAVFFGFFPILLISAWFITRKNSLNISKYIVLSVIVWCLVLSPWVIRNYNLFQTLVPISSGGGNSLLTGNSPFATGTWRVENGFEKWYKERAEENGYTNITELNEVQLSSLSRTLALEYIITHPWQTIQLTLKKAHIFWIYPATHTDNNIPIQLIAVIFDFLFLLVALLGVVTAPKLHRHILIIMSAILFFFLIQIILHAEARFRLPLIPLLCLFFGWGTTIFTDKKKFVSMLSSKKKLITYGLLITGITIIYVYTGILFLNGLI